MYRSPIEESLNSEYGIKTLVKAYAKFYLNRTPFKVVETDNAILPQDEYNISYGIEDIMSVENLSQTYRFGHGNSFTILGNGSSYKERIRNYKTPGKVPQDRLYIAGEDVSYKYYMTTHISSGVASSTGEGYKSTIGNTLGVPTIEYYDNTGADKFLPCNTITTKWNTVTSSPISYKIWIKSRAVDTTGSGSWNVIYDSHVNGQLPLRTGEKYGAASVVNTDNETTRIQLTKFDYSLPPVPFNVDGYITGKRRAWQSGDYMDFDIGEQISIINVDNSINGVSKIINVDKEAGWIEVYGNINVNSSINIESYLPEISVINPGELSIYRQPNGEWSSTPNYWSEDNNNLIDICGVKIEIIGISQRSSRAEMIELSPALSADISKFVKSVSIKEELADRDVTLPIGTVSANSGSIDLSNDTMLFDKTNIRRRSSATGWTGSYFAEMLDDGVEFNIYYEITSLQDNTTDIIPACPMVSDTWPPSEDYGVISVSLLDYSKFLQDRSAPDLILQSYSVTSIIYILLDKCGFSRTMFWPENNFAQGKEPIIDYFWCKKEDSVWSVLQDLAKSTQTAIFFDRYGYLRILPLSVLTDRFRGESSKNVWNIRSVSTNEGLSNIFKINREPSVGANTVIVKYHPANIHGPAGVVARDTFWVPPDNYSMGVAELATEIKSDDTVITTVSDGQSPPFPRFASFVNLGNDIVQFDATQVELTSATGNNRTQPGEKRWLKNESERLTAVLDNNGQPVHFNGIVRVKEGQKQRMDKLSADSNMGFVMKKLYPNEHWRNCSANSCLNHNHRNNTWILTAPYDNAIVAGIKDFQIPHKTAIMKFKVTSGRNINQPGSTLVGIVLHPQSPFGLDSMYVIGCGLGDDKKIAGKQPAVKAYRMSTDGTLISIKKISGSIKPADMGTPVVKDTWNWLEVETVKQPKTEHILFDVYLNGLKVGTFVDTESGHGGKLAVNSFGGFFCKNGTVEIDKLIMAYVPPKYKTRIQGTHVLSDTEEKIEMSSITYFTRRALEAHKTKSGNIPKHLSYSDVDGVYDQYIRLIKTRVGSFIRIEEFNNIIKEYVEDSVRFENGPAITAEVVNLNPNVSVDYFACSPFGAKFRLRNNSNEVQLLSGSQDVASADGGVTATQYLAVVGNSINKTDAEVTVTSKDYKQRLGEKRLEFDGVWLQSREQAEQIARWIIENQGDGAEVYSVSIFGNPLMAIGDQIDIEYAEKGLFPGKQRFVIVAINNTVEFGHSTEIAVRRIYPKATEIKTADLDWK